MSLPGPPVLKTTIIQLNKELDSDENNYEILTNEYLNGAGTSTETKDNISPVIPKKKRRRSSANIDSHELAKRKHETKQLHSIIEKRRRIKINREFEALKYLIPACRMSNSSPSLKPKNSNGNKIDGMYKLTILKSSVEYILYLHHLIQKQQELILSYDKNYKFDHSFTKIPLNVNQYRNIDKEFNFKSLISDLDPSVDENDEQELEATESVEQVNADQMNNRNYETIETTLQGSSSGDSVTPSQDNQDVDSENVDQLTSPDFTPEINPIFSTLNKFRDVRKKSYPISPHTVALSTSTSPFSGPLISSAKRSSFTLPDPALNPKLEVPRKKYFKSKIPGGNAIISEEDDSVLSDHDASRTLLSLRKSSIDNLLN